jgi:hypothetical protein
MEIPIGQRPSPPVGRRMPETLTCRGDAEPPNPAPWTIAGGPDLAYEDPAREARRESLTDPRLVDRFRLVDPSTEPAYEHMIRALDLVWECPDDATVNVVGYRCAGCGSSREVAILSARCRDG